MFKNSLDKHYDFVRFNLKDSILKVVNELGYIKPTHVQLKCIPLFLKGYDILGIAKTGSGKTASFVLPILNNIILSNSCIQSLVLVPTRELVIQISNSFIKFSKYLNNIRILSLYGGQRYNIQLFGLKNKPHIVVSTPGRLLDHIRNKKVYISNVKMLVIDEADEMFRMGFIKDVENIILNISNKHQTSLFSATMPFSIKNIVNRFMNKPKEVLLNYKNKSHILPKNIYQYYCFINNSKDKLNVLIKFLETESFNTVIIFVSTKIYTLKLSNYIKNMGYSCSPFNGDMNQNLRERILNDLYNSKISILVATDIASRGLDIRNINLVINYDVPFDIEHYIHRIGRTGRAGNFGKTILFIGNRERKFLFLIRKHIKSDIKRISIPSIKTLIKIRKLKILNFLNDYLLKNKNKSLFFYEKILDELNMKNFKYLSCFLLKIIYENKFFNNL